MDTKQHVSDLCVAATNFLNIECQPELLAALAVNWQHGGSLKLTLHLAAAQSFASLASTDAAGNSFELGRIQIRSPFDDGVARELERIRRAAN